MIFTGPSVTIFPARLLSATLLTLLAACASQPEIRPEPQSTPVSAARPGNEQPPATIVLKPSHPRRYVVKRGDTLWDIASRFLRDPWLWPEVWQVNPQVANPHLIYPGDILLLTYIDGKPVIQVRRADRSTLKLSPQVRVEDLERAVPTIPLDAIGPFLSRPRVLTDRQFELAPYVVSNADEHLMTGAGNRIYVRGIDTAETMDYVVVRRGSAYRDPDSGEILGYEGVYVADARLIGYGDPSTLRLVASKRESLNGDRLFPAEYASVSNHFIPRAPRHDLAGSIIAVVDGVTQIGQYQIVVLNRGRQEGLEPGNVLAVYREGEWVRDRIEGGQVKLPNERAGLVMAFRIFDRVSYALVMNATRTIHVLDSVRNP